MSRVARTVHIEAPAADIWAVLTVVEGWPSWASQVRRLERLEPGPLALGSRVRISAPRLPASVWVVTEYEEPRSFTWESAFLPGVRLIGWHVLTPDASGTNVELALEATGALGRLLNPILARAIFNRNTRTATDGLKRHIEARD
jgi:uncharacterized membrane protein